MEFACLGELSLEQSERNAVGVAVDKVFWFAACTELVLRPACPGWRIRRAGLAVFGYRFGGRPELGQPKVLS